MGIRRKEKETEERNDDGVADSDRVPSVSATHRATTNFSRFSVSLTTNYLQVPSLRRGNCVLRNDEATPSSFVASYSQGYAICLICLI